MDGPQVRATFNQMGGRRVPQGVRGDVRGIRHAPHHAMNCLSHCPLIDATTPAAEKEGIGAGRGHEVGPPISEPVIERPLSGRSVRNRSFLGALPHHPHGESTRVEIGLINADQLTHPNARGVEEFSHRSITQGNWVAVVGRDGRTIEHRCGLVDT